MLRFYYIWLQNKMSNSRFGLRKLLPDAITSSRGKIIMLSVTRSCTVVDV